MKIGGHKIGRGEPVFLVAEIGVTANGDLGQALELVHAIAESGATAAKFILTEPDLIMSRRDVPFSYRTLGGEVTRPIYDLLRETTFSYDDWHTISGYCAAMDVVFFATVDHLEGVELLEDLEVPAYKTSAWDLAWTPLFDRLRYTGKPILVDVGAATREEIIAAMPLDDPQYLFVHAPHPTPAGDWNMSRVSGFFRPDYPFGFSSPGRETWCDFVALGGGACFLEKRLTLRRDEPRGHHHAVSLEPDEFKQWVRDVRKAEAAIREEAFTHSEEAWAERKKWDRGPDGRRP